MRFTLCGCGQIGVPCSHQFVAKVTSDGKALVYSTFLTGYDEGNVAITVNASGSAYVAGSTSGDPSQSYPVTPGAFATVFPSHVPPATCGVPFLTFTFPKAAYVSKLNADGTGLLFSTYLGGSGQEGVSGVALDRAGNIIVSGTTSSPDFPGIAPTPARCLPQDAVQRSDVLNLGQIYPGQVQEGFAARLNPDGSAVTGAQLFAGGAVGARSLALAGNRAWISADSYVTPFIFSGGLYGQTDTPVERALTLPGVADAPGATFVAAVDLDAPAPAEVLACMQDAADYAFLGPVVPGQLITLFGSGLGPAAGAVAQPAGGTFPNSLAGTTVTFDGRLAPLLYASDGQINLVAPYELAGQAATTMQINVNGAAVAERVMPVGVSAPALFTSPTVQTCPGATGAGALAFVLNEDGTQNSCTNPAPGGSVVSVFVSGLGVTGNQLPDGALNPATPPPLTLPVQVLGSGVTLDSATAAPNQVSGVWQIRLKVNAANPGCVQLTVGGVAVQGQIQIY